MIETKTLKNGTRVIVKRMEDLRSVTMGILVGTGAAYETDAEDGLSHFIEHMQFKGTPTRTAFEISDAFDALGAQVNAFTGKDMTCYYSKSISERAAEAFELLADLFLNASFPEDEMEREKGVVLEEINMDEDSPEDLCLDLLSRAAYGRVGYGRNILGPAKNVTGFTREDIFAYKKKRYCTENIVISFAGNIEISAAMELVEKYFGALERTPIEARTPNVLWHAETLFEKKPFKQAPFAVGFPTVSRDDALRPAVLTMNNILGGGMSSRLFKRVREELGLAYSVYSYTSHYAEAGILAVYAGVEPQKAQSAAQAIREVIEQFKKEGATPEELDRAKAQLKSGNIFSQESTSSLMLLYGRNLLYSNEVYDFEQHLAEIDALTLDDIKRAIDASFDFDKMAIACVGDMEKPISL